MPALERSSFSAGRPVSGHECEKWQLLPHARGGAYCGACGVTSGVVWPTVVDTRPIREENHPMTRTIPAREIRIGDAFPGCPEIVEVDDFTTIGVVYVRDRDGDTTTLNHGDPVRVIRPVVAPPHHPALFTPEV